MKKAYFPDRLKSNNLQQLSTQHIRKLLASHTPPQHNTQNIYVNRKHAHKT